MEQNNYKEEIVNLLSKGKDYARSIAKKLSTNHTTINRKLKELRKENIIDYKEEGRNKTYFLKETIEAKEYRIIAEKHKLLKIIKKYPELREIIGNIKENKKIKLAMIFGSYAKQKAKSDSDIDLYIETENPEIKKELSRISEKLSIKTGKLDKDSPLAKEIKKDHVIVKGTESYCERY